MNNNFNNKGNNKQQNVETVKESGSFVFWEIVKDFWKKAILGTPFESIFQFALLVAGATRTLDLLNTMGQSGFAAIIGLIYAELGIPLYEVLGYRGKRVRKEKVVNGKTFKYFPFWNQKTIAKIGLWAIHIPLTVFFTTSDIILSNLEAVGRGITPESFAWVLGGVIGLGFFADLVLVINYKEQDPENVHRELMEQIAFEKRQIELQIEEAEAQAENEYRLKNARPLAQAKAQLGAREELQRTYGGTFSKDDIERVMGDVELEGRSVVKPNFPQSAGRPNFPQNQNGNQRPQLPQPNQQPSQRNFPKGLPGNNLNAPQNNHQITPPRKPIQQPEEILKGNADEVKLPENFTKPGKDEN